MAKHGFLASQGLKNFYLQPFPQARQSYPVHVGSIVRSNEDLAEGVEKLAAARQTQAPARAQRRA